MSYIHVPTLSPILEEEEQLIDTRFPPKNSKRDKRRYKRNIKRQRRAYFSKIVEDKKWDDETFLDDIHEWYFA